MANDRLPPLEDIVLYREPLSNCCSLYDHQLAAENARHTAALGTLRKKLTDSPEYKGEQTRYAAEQKACNDRLTNGEVGFSYVDCMTTANHGHTTRGAEIEAAVYTPFYNRECTAHEERVNYIEYARYACCNGSTSLGVCCDKGGDGANNPM